MATADVALADMRANPGQVWASGYDSWRYRVWGGKLEGRRGDSRWSAVAPDGFELLLDTWEPVHDPRTFAEIIPALDRGERFTQPTWGKKAHIYIDVVGDLRNRQQTHNNYDPLAHLSRRELVKPTWIPWKG